MRKVIGIIALALTVGLSATAQTTDTMDRIEVCKQNYHTLFGGEALTGQGTDPEMMDILQKFIFGEVFQTGELTLKQREMITCITLATMQTLPQLKAHAGAALNVGVTPQDAERRGDGERGVQGAGHQPADGKARHGDGRNAPRDGQGHSG